VRYGLGATDVGNSCCRMIPNAELHRFMFSEVSCSQPSLLGLEEPTPSSNQPFELTVRHG